MTLERSPNNSSSTPLFDDFVQSLDLSSPKETFWLKASFSVISPVPSTTIIQLYTLLSHENSGNESESHRSENTFSGR